MANYEQLQILKKGVDAWNTWRKDISPKFLNLSQADLSDIDLVNVDFSGVDLSEANFYKTNLYEADFTSANLSQANFAETNLENANLRLANLWGTNFMGANLTGANLGHTSPFEGNFREAKLIGANLRSVDLLGANLQGADLRNSILTGARLVKVKIDKAKISGSSVYAVNVWDLFGEFDEQKELIITPLDDAIITVDNIEVAQFVYLLLNNKKIRNVVDTITTKAVLILGRFYEERKQVLNVLKEALREKGFVPILFDFEPSKQRDLTETIQLLANMAKFVIADITDAKSIPQELSHIIPFLPSVPIQPILLVSKEKEYAMFEHWRSFKTVLPEFLYRDKQDLLDNLESRILQPIDTWRKDQNEVSILQNRIKELETKLSDRKRA